MQKTAIIIGAGPAGLTAAYELLKHTDIIPLILERSGDIGGLSKTTDYKGNRMDVGPHRFFSKSDRILAWWQNIMPLQAEGDITIHYHNAAHTVKGRGEELSPAAAPSTESPTGKMKIVKRLSRIYFQKKFFAYPLSFSPSTLGKLGLFRAIGIIGSYLLARLTPRRPEKSLEDFVVNRFGGKLYRLFFKDYTEKVWGRPCSKIPAEWGAQRIQGLSIRKAIAFAVRNTGETSLAEQFLYPPLGAGQLWEEVARQVKAMGGQILHHQVVVAVHARAGKTTGVTVADALEGTVRRYEADYIFSSMPVKELIAGLDTSVPADVREAAAGLQYRNSINVGVLLSRLAMSLPDDWLYIQDPRVKVGRIQVYNNWSPYMVKDPNTTWIGMEYYCNEDDECWHWDEIRIKKRAVEELLQIGLAMREDVLDQTVQKIEKTYPAYVGAYDRFYLIRQYIDTFENLFLVGRNGMHKYNNTDHSMLTAMAAVDNIRAGIAGKANIWSVNTEHEYHEAQKRPARAAPVYNSPA